MFGGGRKNKLLTTALVALTKVLKLTNEVERRIKTGLYSTKAKRGGSVKNIKSATKYMMLF